MSLDLAAQEERIQSLADILSLVAIVGGMEKSAIQRVLITLGSSLLDVRAPLMVDRDLASRPDGGDSTDDFEAKGHVTPRGYELQACSLGRVAAAGTWLKI